MLRLACPTVASGTAGQASSGTQLEKQWHPTGTAVALNWYSRAGQTGSLPHVNQERLEVQHTCLSVENV